MKKLLLSTLLLLPILGFANPQQEALVAIYQNTLTANVEHSMDSCKALQKSVQQSAKPKQARLDFKALVERWKQVEALYIWGDYDGDASDYPRYIDMFNQGNEDLQQQILQLLKSDDEVSLALFKHSFKSIGALAVVLYESDDLSARHYEFAQVMVANICKRLGDIAEVQKQHEKDFLSDKNKAAALLMNALIDSSYKLREWRVGAAAGLSRKYKDSVDAKRLEYYQSGLSLAAILAILHAHEQLLAEAYQPNFASLAVNLDAKKSISKTQKILAESIRLAKALSEKELPNTNRTKPLFDSLNELQDAYYNDLLESLGLAAKIIEADSD